MLNSHLTKSRRRWKLHRRLKPKLTPSRRTIASCLHVGWNLERFIARSLCLSCCKVLSTSFQQELIVIDPKMTLKFLGSSELVLVFYPPVLRIIFCIGSAAEPVMLRHCWDNFLCPCALCPNFQVRLPVVARCSSFSWWSSARCTPFTSNLERVLLKPTVFFTICLLANHFFTICLGCDRMMIIFVFVTFRVF